MLLLLPRTSHGEPLSQKTISYRHNSPIASCHQVITSKGWRGFQEVTSPLPSHGRITSTCVTPGRCLSLCFKAVSAGDAASSSGSVLQCVTDLITRRFQPESFLLQFKPITSCPICKRRGQLIIPFLFAAVLYIFEDCFVDTDYQGTKSSLRRCLSPHRWNQTTFGCNVQWQNFYCKFTLQNELKTEMKPHWKSHIKGIYIPFLLSFKLQTRLFLTYM